MEHDYNSYCLVIPENLVLYLIDMDVSAAENSQGIQIRLPETETMDLFTGTGQNFVRSVYNGANLTWWVSTQGVPQGTYRYITTNFYEVSHQGRLYIKILIKHAGGNRWVLQNVYQ